MYARTYFVSWKLDYFPVHQSVSTWTTANDGSLDHHTAGPSQP